MELAPVEYLVVGFPGNHFRGEAAPELQKLVASGTIRILDLTFVGKQADGTVVTFQFDQLDELVPYTEIDAEVGGIIDADDVDHVAGLLEPGSSAALLVWEDLWAAPFAEALRRAQGVVLEGARIPRNLIQNAFDGLQTA